MYKLENKLHKLDCLLINFQLNKGDTKILPESNGYAICVVVILSEMNIITYLYAMNSLLDNGEIYNWYVKSKYKFY